MPTSSTISGMLLAKEAMAPGKQQPIRIEQYIKRGPIERKQRSAIKRSGMLLAKKETAANKNGGVIKR